MIEAKEQILIGHMKGKRRRKTNNIQVLRKSQVKFISAVGIHLLTSFWIHLCFLISSRSWSRSSNFWQHHLYLFPLILEGASVANESVKPQCLPWGTLFSLLGKLWVCSPCSYPSCRSLIKFISNNVQFLIKQLTISCGGGAICVRVSALSCLVQPAAVCGSGGWAEPRIPLAVHFLNFLLRWPQ